jgi:regulator of protease activity HflC (stomatin/prohibitin superfamily)
VDREVQVRGLVGRGVKWAGFGVLGLVALVTGCNSFATVDAQRVGLKNTYGQISDTTLSPGGPYLINPFTTNIEEMDVGSDKWADKTPTYTKDLQTADVSFTLVYHLDPSYAVRIRRQYGPGDAWRNVLVPPIVQSSIKNIYAQYDAMAAVAQRPTIQNRITNVVRDRLRNRGVIVDGFELTNLDYSDQFEDAVEQAQVATQRAVAARNQTVTVREEAIQKEIRSKAEADAIQRQAQAISANPAIVEMRRIERWNGQLCPEGSQTCIIGGAGANTMLSVGGGK